MIPGASEPTIHKGWSLVCPRALKSHVLCVRLTPQELNLMFSCPVVYTLTPKKKVKMGTRSAICRNYPTVRITPPYLITQDKDSHFQ